MKKIIILLAFLLVTLITNAQTFIVDSIKYNILSNNTVEVAQFTISEYPFNSTYHDSIILKDTVIYNDSTYILTKLSRCAFANSKITYISIPNSVSEIDTACFGNCTKLKSIIIPPLVKNIRQGCFLSDSLEYIIFNDSLKVIEDYAFCNNFILNNFVLPEGLEEIQQGAFIFCESLTQVIIPTGVTIIRDSAFQHCINLDSLTFAPQSISAYAFAGCSNLKVINSLSEAPPEFNLESTFTDELIDTKLIVCDTLAYINSEWGLKFNNIKKATNCSVGLIDEALKETLKIYPNPAKDDITIINSTGLINIYDIKGVLISSNKINNMTKINISHLTPGIYIVNVDNFSYRLIKE